MDFPTRQSANMGPNVTIRRGAGAMVPAWSGQAGTQGRTGRPCGGRLPPTGVVGGWSDPAMAPTGSTAPTHQFLGFPFSTDLPLLGVHALPALECLSVCPGVSIGLTTP